MLEYLSPSHDNVVAVKATGKLTHEDYQQFLARLEQTIETRGPLRVLFDLSGLHGWEPSVMWDDLKFEMHHGRDFERCAIVGDKAWQEWLIKLSKPFIGSEVQYFHRDELPHAMEWIEQGVGASA